MIALDTNVRVRFLVQDDPTQSHLATNVIEQLTEDPPGFGPSRSDDQIGVGSGARLLPEPRRDRRSA